MAVPPNIIEEIKVVRTSQQMLPEIGPSPTPKNSRQGWPLPLEKVLKVLEIAKRPIRMETPLGEDP